MQHPCSMNTGAGHCAPSHEAWECCLRPEFAILDLIVVDPFGSILYTTLAGLHCSWPGQLQDTGPFQLWLGPRALNGNDWLLLLIKEPSISCCRKEVL